MGLTFPVSPHNSPRTSVAARDWNSSPTFGWAIETTSVGSFLLLHSVEKNSPTIPLHKGMWGSIQRWRVFAESQVELSLFFFVCHCPYLFLAKLQYQSDIRIHRTMWTNVKGSERLIKYRESHPEILIQSNLIKKIYLFKPSSSR